MRNWIGRAVLLFAQLLGAMAAGVALCLIQIHWGPVPVIIAVFALLVVVVVDIEGPPWD